MKSSSVSRDTAPSPHPHSDPAPGAAAGTAPFPRRAKIPGLNVVTHIGEPQDEGWREVYRTVFSFSGVPGAGCGTSRSW